MPSTQARILCLDSSDTRRIRLHAVLEKAGFDVWMSRDVADALSLATRLRLDAVVADQTSTLGHEENWEKLKATRSTLPVLVHSATRCIVGEYAAVRSGSPQVIMAILTLLLGPAGRPEPEVPAPQAA